MKNIEIFEVGLDELDSILRIQESEESPNHSRRIVGFEHIYSDTAWDRLYLEQTEYAKSKKMRKFEIQEQLRKYDSDYDVSVVAMNDRELVGLVSMKWFYDDFGEDKLWNYRNRIISVKDSYLNQGVAKGLLKTLEKTKKIEGKVLRFGNFTEDGEAYLRHVIPRIFVNNNYIVVPKDDWRYGKPLPKKKGCYLFGDYD